MTIADTNPRQAAKFAGVGYLALFVLAIFANFFVRTGLVAVDDAATTFANIANSEGLFRAGLVSFLAIFILDVAIAWALYVVFNTVNRQWSLAAAWFRIVYTVFLGVAAIFFFVVLQLVGGSEYLASFTQAQLEAQTMLALDAFNYTWLIGLAAFGFHLIVIGFMMRKSAIAPRGLAWVLTIAGAAYIIDTTAYATLSNYADFADVLLAMVALPSVVGELWFAFWLLSKGRKTAKAPLPTEESTTDERDRSAPQPTALAGLPAGSGQPVR